MPHAFFLGEMGGLGCGGHRNFQAPRFPNAICTCMVLAVATASFQTPREMQGQRASVQISSLFPTIITFKHVSVHCDWQSDLVTAFYGDLCRESCVIESYSDLQYGVLRPRQSLLSASQCCSRCDPYHGADRDRGASPQKVVFVSLALVLVFKCAICLAWGLGPPPRSCKTKSSCMS
jgi:hypothetical protein